MSVYPKWEPTLSIPADLKEWIDSASYEDLLRKVRHAPAGDPCFVGDTSKYFGDVMSKRKRQVGDDGAVAASKRIGW